MSQFFYKRTVEGKVYTDSFNTDKVIRTVELEDGKRVVILDDFHERVDEVPDINIKTNKMMGVKRQRNTYQSEITLEAEDAEKFQKVMSI